MITAAQASQRTHAALTGMVNSPLMSEIKTYILGKLEAAILEAADQGLRFINIDVDIPKAYQVRPEHLDFVIERLFKDLDSSYIAKYCLSSSFLVNFQISWPKVE